MPHLKRAETMLETVKLKMEGLERPGEEDAKRILSEFEVLRRKAAVHGTRDLKLKREIEGFVKVNQGLKGDGMKGVLEQARVLLQKCVDGIQEAKGIRDEALRLFHESEQEEDPEKAEGLLKRAISNFQTVRSEDYRNAFEEDELEEIVIKQQVAEDLMTTKISPRAQVARTFLEMDEGFNRLSKGDDVEAWERLYVESRNTLEGIISEDAFGNEIRREATERLEGLDNMYKKLSAFGFIFTESDIKALGRILSSDKTLQKKELIALAIFTFELMNPSSWKSSFNLNSFKRGNYRTKDYYQVALRSLISSYIEFKEAFFAKKSNYKNDYVRAIIGVKSKRPPRSLYVQLGNEIIEVTQQDLEEIFSEQVIVNVLTKMERTENYKAATKFATKLAEEMNKCKIDLQKRQPKDLVYKLFLNERAILKKSFRTAIRQGSK